MGLLPGVERRRLGRQVEGRGRFGGQTGDLAVEGEDVDAAAMPLRQKGGQPGLGTQCGSAVDNGQDARAEAQWVARPRPRRSVGDRASQGVEGQVRRVVGWRVDMR